MEKRYDAVHTICRNKRLRIRKSAAFPVLPTLHDYSNICTMSKKTVHVFILFYKLPLKFRAEAFLIGKRMLFFL